MRSIDKNLPRRENDNTDSSSIPTKDADQYAKLYRYLPNFASFEP